jgi:death-on-curing protein
MPLRRNFRVRTLAREENLDPEDTALVLMEAGYSEIRSPDSLVAGRRNTKLARRLIREYKIEVERAKERARDSFVWPRLEVGTVECLTKDEVTAIHQALTDEFAGTPDAIWPVGVKDEGLLDSAIHRPLIASAKFSNVPAAGAALLHGLQQNHVFHNGNNRTSLVALVLFLIRNNHYMLFDQDELYRLIVGLASHTIVPVSATRPNADHEAFAAYEWLVRNTRPHQSGDFPLKWGELERTLEHFDCDMHIRHGGKCEIKRGTREITIRYLGRTSEVRKSDVRKIRRGLELSGSHGIDSVVFYNRGRIMPDPLGIIEKYRPVLQRLAQFDES